MRTATLVVLLFFVGVSSSHAFLDWFRSDKDVDYSIPTAEQVEEAETIYSTALEQSEKGQYRTTIRTLRQILLNYSNTPVAADALYLTAEMEMKRGKRKNAFETFQKIVNRYPGYERFDDVIDHQYTIASQYMDGARDSFLWIFPGFQQKQRAIEFFEVVIRNAPYTDYAPRALMNIALLSQARSDEELAIDALDRLITLYPRSYITPDAYFALAQIFASLIQGPDYDQGSTLEALNYYQDFLILFPQSRHVPEAEEGIRLVSEIFAQSRLLIAEFYYVNRHNETAARIFYNQTITVAPDSEAAQIARERIERIDEGRSPPRFKKTTRSTRVRTNVDSFFQERWDERNEAGMEDEGIRYQAPRTSRAR